MTKLTLAGAALMMMIVGALHLFAPQMMMNDAKLALTSASHFHVIRAAYGGAYLGIGALFAMGWFRPALASFSLLSIAIVFIGFATGRVYSMVVDGLPVPLYLGVLGAELLFSALAILALRQRDQW
ncbi:MAG: DUF4345 domain-containing protein [Rhodoferax sp.]|nr:DUF4345 domain-containing protein [Rhodoferax sp.]